MGCFELTLPLDTVVCTSFGAWHGLGVRVTECQGGFEQMYSVYNEI